MRMDRVVVDVEIQKRIEDVPGGWEATDLLGVAVACVWEHTDRRLRVYGPDDVEALRARLLKADEVIGYNVWKFDFPVIWGLPGRGRVEELRGKTNDLLRRVWKAMGLDPDEFTFAHRGTGLNAVAEQTLNRTKVGNGADAPRWYQAGQVQRVVNYCADDACLERDLSDFIDEHGYVNVNGSQLLIPQWNGEA